MYQHVYYPILYSFLTVRYKNFSYKLGYKYTYVCMYLVEPSRWSWIKYPPQILLQENPGYFGNKIC